MKLNITDDRCRECGDSAYAHMKYPDRMGKTNLFEGVNYILDVNLLDLSFPSNRKREDGTFCSQFTPKDNLKYLEYLYDKNSR